MAGEVSAIRMRSSSSMGVGPSKPVMRARSLASAMHPGRRLSPREIVNGHHLIGAFWLAVDHRCRRYREGRHLTRMGSRQRVDFDLTATQAPSTTNPFDRLELRDRFARAADFIADLDQRELTVVSVMAARGIGPVSAARVLDMPLGEARAAARSAGLKLDRIAAIAAAGRMCEFRARVVTADAEGTATEREARLAKAHVSACVPCGRTYRQIRREMHGRDFQRAAVAAFLPPPVLATGGHTGGIGKLAIWLEHRVNFIPRGSGERAAEVLGGAGVVKMAAAGTAIVAAGGAWTAPIVHVVENGSAKHHASAHVVRRSERERQQGANAKDAAVLAVHMPAHWTVQTERPRRKVHHGLPTPPSKSLDYLALGGPSGASRTRTQLSTKSTARIASVSIAAPERTESAPSSSQSGGGTSLGYLGK